MSECFAKEEFTFLDRNIITSDGNLVKALREIRRLTEQIAQVREVLVKGLDRTVTDESVYQLAAIAMNGIYWRDKQNESVRAKYAEIRQAIRFPHDCKHELEDAALCDECRFEWEKRIAAVLKQDNPGQALLKHVKALERVRELLATFCEPIRIEIEERGEVGDDYDRFWRGQLAIAEKALAACEDGQEELK